MNDINKRERKVSVQAQIKFAKAEVSRLKRDIAMRLKLQALREQAERLHDTLDSLR